jgi:hypothetical protein
MRRWISGLLFLFAFLGVAHGRASTLIVSDVDDTIKLADVVNLFGAARYALDEHSAFLGMNHLYQKLIQDNRGARIVYLSQAPEWLMKKKHLDFLRNNSFPSGLYRGRGGVGVGQQKIKTLREVLARYQPTRVILIGDNGEEDPQNYRQIVSENASRGIEFQTYIHIVYADRSGIYPEQTGFVTAVELAADLQLKNFLSAASVRGLMDRDLPLILKEKPGSKKGSLAFPHFMDCRPLLWQWDIPGLNEKIRSVCHR